MIRLLVIVLVVFCCNISYGQKASHFYGTIGDFPIEMELYQEDGHLTGWYWYPNKSEKLKIEGVLSHDSVFKIREFNSRGVLTGVFQGQFSSNYIAEGVWQNPEQTKEFNFKLKLDNNISVFTGRRVETMTANNVQSSKLIDRPSKIRGMSQLWLIVFSAFLIVSLVLMVYFFRSRKQLKEKPTVLVEKQEKIFFVNDSTLPDSYTDETKGERFQQYVVSMFNNKPDFFEWEHATSDLKYGNLYPRSNMDPDLIFKFKHERLGLEEKIAVECKYRAGLINNVVEIEKERKLYNYRLFQEKERIPTFLALGFGGNADAPKKIFVIPIERVHSKMRLEDLDMYCNKRDYFFYDYEQKILK